MNIVLFSNQKPTNGKKGKSHKMYVFAQDIGIRNLVKINLVSTVPTPIFNYKENLE
jgi:hypothetical protein